MESSNDLDIGAIVGMHLRFTYRHVATDLLFLSGIVVGVLAVVAMAAAAGYFVAMRARHPPHRDGSVEMTASHTDAHGNPRPPKHV